MESSINMTAKNSSQDLKKKVLFIITQSEMGGAQRFLDILTTHLDKTKYDILVAAGPAGTLKMRRKTHDTRYDLLDQLEKGGVRVMRLPSLQRNIGPFLDLRAIFELRRTIKEFRPNTLFLLSSKAGFLGSLIPKFIIHHSSFKVIYRIGGWSFNDPGPRWKKWLWIYLERWSARWKDVIIVNNKHDFDQAKKFKIVPRHEIKIIYNGIDVYKTDFLEKDGARLKLFEKISKNFGKIFNAPIIIGTIANFYSTKGLEYLIDTAEYFKNNDETVFVVIGDGIERSSLEKLITERGLEKKILLLGQIANAYQLLPAFDIFVLPSVKEGFPWVVVEAMNAKIPVIATRVGAIPEIIEDGKNGIIVEPAKPEQIARRLQELITNDRLRQELAIQGHQTVLFKFTLEKMLKEFESIL